MSKGKVVLGLLAGVAAGALLGILFAPDKGSKTRKRISKKGEDYLEDLQEKLDDFVKGLSEKLDDAYEEADELIEKGKSKAQEIKSDMHNALSKDITQ